MQEPDYRIRKLGAPDPVLPKELSSVQALWAHEDPYDLEGTDEIFTDAMRQVLRWHAARCPFYADWLRRNSFDPDSLKDVSDLPRIPPLHANFYKTHVIKSRPDEEFVLTLTSSGTSGQKTQMFFDEWSINASDKSADVQFAYYGRVTDVPSEFMMYSYEPAPGVNTGTLRTRQMMRRYAPEHDLEYALKFNGSGHDFDLFGSIKALKRFEEGGRPVRILGFPAFLYFTLERMREMGYPPLKLNPDSLVMMGGGWKGFVDKQLSPQEFRDYIHDRLGLPHTCCHETYGAVEHGVAYTDCDNHHLHIPIYSRAVIRDPETLEPVEDGEKGFMNVISPMNTGVPVPSLLLGDMAVKHPAGSCGCGNPAPWFEILGRAGTSRNKSCAIAASEILRRR